MLLDKFCKRGKIWKNLRARHCPRGTGDNMGLTRKYLSALGIEADKIEEIITAHAETVDALKEERDKYKAGAETAESAKKELETLKAQNTNYEKLKAEFDKYKADVESEKTLTAKKEAYRAIAEDSGLSEKGIEKVMKYTDFANIELDEDGKVKDAKTHIKQMREEWSEHVIKTETQGAEVAKPLATGGSRLTKNQILGIKDDKERIKTIAENMDLFEN